MKNRFEGEEKQGKGMVEWNTGHNGGIRAEGPRRKHSVAVLGIDWRNRDAAGRTTRRARAGNTVKL